MGVSQYILTVSAATALVFSSTIFDQRAVAGPLDGLAGAAVGFALGAMVTAPRHGYYAPRGPRVVYRNRVSRPHYASARRAPVARRGGAAISTVSDPFAGSGSAKPIPVGGN